MLSPDPYPSLPQSQPVLWDWGRRRSPGDHLASCEHPAPGTLQEDAGEQGEVWGGASGKGTVGGSRGKVGVDLEKVEVSV